jgi:hypothetical protein
VVAAIGAFGLSKQTPGAMSGPDAHEGGAFA